MSTNILFVSIFFVWSFIFPFLNYFRLSRYYLFCFSFSLQGFSYIFKKLYFGVFHINKIYIHILLSTLKSQLYQL